MQTEKTVAVDSKESESNRGEPVGIVGAQSYHPECSQLKIPLDVWHRNS